MIINKRLKIRWGSIAACIGIVTGILATFFSWLSYLQSIKEPDLLVGIVNQHRYELESLYLEKDSNNRVYYGGGVPSIWQLTVSNIGERTANNIALTLMFENISFERDYIFSYITLEHQRGVGGWRGLKYYKEIDLLPGETLSFPLLPFEGQAYTYDNTEKFKMKIAIYADNINTTEKIYLGNLKNKPKDEIIDYSGHLRFKSILNELGKVDDILVTTYAFSDNNNFSVQIPETLEKDDLNFAYNYCLERIDSANSYNMGKYALLFGRSYYGHTTGDISFVEKMIANDIWAETNK